MASRLIDQLFVGIGFQPDTSGLDRVVRKMRDVDRQVTKIARGLNLAIGAALGIGTATFVTGSKIERELLNLRTQLGETEESVDAIKPALKSLSKDTAVPLDRLTAGFFALRSAGLSTEAAMETLTASAHGVNAGMGDIRDIAFTAGGSVVAYGEDAMTGARATDILLATVQKGNLVATDLTRGFGELLQVSPELGVEMEQLGAIIAGATGPGVSANVVMTQLRQILFGLLRPTETAKKQFEQMGISTDELARRVDEDLVGALQWLRQEAGEDKEAFSRLFESQEAVGLIFGITGERAGVYRDALEDIRASAGLTNEAHEIWAQSGLAQVEKAGNETKLALNDLYDNAVAPLLKLFGKLNTVIQQVIIALGGASLASSIFGGPSLGRVIAALSVKLVRLRWVNRQLRIMRVVLLRRVMPALRGFVRAMGRAALAMLRFATRAIVAGIAGVVAFAASIWTGAVPALAAFAAGVWATTVAMLANPVGLIVLAIVGLIAALVLLVKHWDTVKRVVRDFFDRYGNYVLAALAVVAPFIGIPLLIARNWDQIVGIVGGIWSRVNDTVRGWIEAIIDFVRELPGRVVGILKDIPGMVADAIRDVPGLGVALEAFTGIAGKVGKALGFAEGGIVPGPLGRPLLATVHGGEMVLPVGASRVIAQMLEGFRLGPAALPQAPHYYGQMYRSLVDNRSVTVHIHEPIVIHTEATDAKGIAQELGEAIQDQIRNVAYDHDGPVER